MRRYRGVGRLGLVGVVGAVLVGCGGAGGGVPSDSGSASVSASGSESESASGSESASVAAGSAGVSGAASASPSSFVAPLGDSQLQGRWWSWAASEPEGTNPVSDEDGRDCARRQPKDVWFLAGTFGTEAKRRCTVPAGVPLAFPLVNSYTADEAGCAGFMMDAVGSAALDGKELAARRIDGAPIVVTGLEGNAVTGEAGSVLARGCGIWVQMPAPAEGRHVLEIKGRNGGFRVGVVYELTVAG